MGFPKSMAIAVSGSVLAGGIALAMGAATPASAEVVVAAAQKVISGNDCCGHRSSRLSGRNVNINRHLQRFALTNRIRISNSNKSDSDAQQRQQLQDFPSTSSSSSAAAAGGGGGGGGGTGGTDTSTGTG